MAIDNHMLIGAEVHIIHAEGIKVDQIRQGLMRLAGLPLGETLQYLKVSRYPTGSNQLNVYLSLIGGSSGEKQQPYVTLDGGNTYDRSLPDGVEHETLIAVAKNFEDPLVASVDCDSSCVGCYVGAISLSPN